MPDADGVARRACREIAGHLSEALLRRGVAHLALSGGTTPRLAYELLARAHEHWGAVEVWFVDERCVAPEDEQSNYRLADETLLTRAPIDRARVHRMQGELGAELGAQLYGEELEHRVPARQGSDAGLPALDVAVLGIGPDGHVASLFPGASTLDAPQDALCLPVHDAPKPPPERMTLSLGVINAARRCVLLATGAGKADALSAAMGEPSRHVPASLLAKERLTIVADDAASPATPRR